MIEIYQAYLATLLKSAGIKTKICITMKELQSFDNAHVGAVIVDKDLIESSYDKKIYEDMGKTKKRIKKYRRDTTINVVIGEHDATKCDSIFAKFLSIIEKGTYDANGNWVEIELGEAEWVSDKDSILKSKIAVEMPIIFHGGIYQDYEYKKVKWAGDGEYVKKGHERE